MDAVGDIIAERGRERFPLGVGTLLAVLLHVTVAGAFVYSTMTHPVRFVSPRTVAVRLLPAGSLRGGEAPAPAAVAPPETKKILKPEPEDAPPPPTDKAVLVPAKEEDKKKTATATRPSPERPKAPDVSLPSSGENAGGGGGGAIGAGGDVGVSGAKFDSDFPFAYYVERLTVAIGMNWIKPNSSGSVSPVIHFQIARDGTISDAEVVKSSGLPFVDRAALRAVVASSPLPPLPAEFPGARLGISVQFN